MNPAWINAAIGGAIIGIAVSLMLLWNGRVTGISGIIYGLFSEKGEAALWRITFIFGLISGGALLRFVRPESFGGTLSTGNWTLVVAGLIVGFGTVLGSGCTSGHGVCGISRLSIRSIVATVTFVLFGMLSVVALRSLGVLP